MGKHHKSPIHARIAHAKGYAMHCHEMLFLVSGYTATTFLSYTPYRICSPWMNQSQIVAQRFLKHQPRFTASHRADYGLYGDPSAA